MSGGAIRFVADTSQFSGEMDKASRSTLNVAASAEDARKRIVASYQQQVKAAQDAGASQAQLASITNRASSQLASVTEDNARRYINSIDRMEERVRRFNAARQTLNTSTITAPTSSFNMGGYAAEENAAKGLATAVEGVSAAHGRGASAAVQFGSVMRGMEGNFSRNVRAAESFGASLSFLGPIVDAAFPIVGAAALGYALFEMGKHAYDAFENVVMLRDAVKGLNEMQIKVDSDHTRSQDKQESDVENILEHSGLGGKSAALKQRYNYQSQKPIDLSSYFYSDSYKKLPDDVKGSFENTYKSIAPGDAAAKIQKITTTINDLNNAISGVKNHTIGAFLPVINGKGPGATRDPLSYYQAQLTAAKQIKTQLTDASDDRTAGLQAIQMDTTAAQTEEQKKAATLSREAAAKATAIRKQQAADMMRGLESDAAVSKQQQEYATHMADVANEWVNEKFTTAGLSPDDSKQLSQSGADQAARITALRQSIDLNKQNSDAIAQSALQMAVATGQMSKLDAARVAATMHTQQYNDALKQLQDQAAYIQIDHQYDQRPAARQAALQTNANQQTALTVGYQIQSAQDRQAYNPASTSASTGFANALDEFVVASQDAATQMRELTTNTLQGLNAQIVDAISGKRTSFGNFGAGVFRSVAGTGLQKAEGSALSMFGFGSSEKLGTPGNPMIVKFADGTSSMTSTAGGFLKSLFGGGGSKGPGQSGLNTALGISGNAAEDDANGGGMGTIASDVLPLLSGGLAIGGSADANSNYLVGEKGPEILSMGSQSGRVIPNSQIGGSTGHTIYIDASGSTDPAQTRVQVTRGIQVAAPHISANTINAQQDQRRRRPTSAR